jgi:hypothetical protein
MVPLTDIPIIPHASDAKRRWISVSLGYRKNNSSCSKRKRDELGEATNQQPLLLLGIGNRETFDGGFDRRVLPFTLIGLESIQACARPQARGAGGVSGIP